jgi:hypothetical protein
VTNIIDPDAGLHRTIPAAHITLDVVLAEAFMAKSDEGLLLSTDQAALSTPAQSFARRLTPPAQVSAITIGDVYEASERVDAEMRVVDDHDPSDTLREAHASVDFSQISVKQLRWAAAAVLAERSVRVHP